MGEKTVYTEYGDVSVEVVECTSCGTEIAKSDAKEFITADEISENGDMKGDVSTGKVCEHCHNTEPIQFPLSLYYKKFNFGESIGMILLFPICLLFVLFEYLFGEIESVPELLVGFVGTLLWTLPPIYIIYFL